MHHKYLILSFLLCLFIYTNIAGAPLNKNENVITDSAIVSIAFKYFENSDYPGASKSFARALTKFKKEKKFENAAVCMYYLAMVAFKQEKYAEANRNLVLLDGFAQKHNLINSYVWEGKFLKGVILLKEYKIEKAYLYFNQLADTFNKYNVPDSTFAKLYHKKGTSEYYKGDFFQSLKSYESSLNYGQKAYGKNSLFASDQINNLGVINFMLGKYNDALHYYKLSEAMLNEGNIIDPIALASTYNNISLVFRNKNDYSNALLFLEKAKDLYMADKANVNKDIANAYQNMAVVYLHLGNKAKQLENIKLALYYCEKYHLYIIPKVYFQMAIYLENENKLPEARIYFEKAIEKSKEIFGDSPDLANAYNNLGEFYLGHNIDIDMASTLFLKSLTFYKNTVGQKHTSTAGCYEHIGRYYLQKGEYQKALNCFHNALLSVSEDFNNTGLYSFPLHTKTLSKSQSIQILKEKAEVIAKLAENTNNSENSVLYLSCALRHYKQSIQLINEIRSEYTVEESRLILSENEQDTYLKTIQIAYELYRLTGNEKYARSAFSMADNSQSASLQVMIEQKDNEKSYLNYPLLNSEVELKKELSLYNTWINTEKNRVFPDSSKIKLWKNKIIEVTFKLEEITNEINKEHPAYRFLVNSFTNHDILDQIQKKIEPNEAIIEYLLIDNVLFSYCVTKDSLKITRNTINPEFYTKIDNVLTFVKHSQVTSSDSVVYMKYRKAAYELYQIVLEPFTDMLQNKSLIIVPNSKLTYLPFCTLLTENTKGKYLNFKELPYIVKKYPVRYLYASGLLNLNIKPEVSKQLLAFSPSYKGRIAQNGSTRDFQFEELHYNKTEVENAVKYFGGKSLSIEKASEENFKALASGYRIIHLAMHAVIDDENPQNSRLIFTPQSSKTEDDLLYSYETYNLKLNTDLLVLSACNTGGGKLHKGEGIFSLTRGFVFAGVKSIIMTLWSVDDKSGARMMDLFYNNLSHNTNKDIALQYSKIEYIQQSDIIHAHPYFWAGYVLIGDNTKLGEHNYRIWWRVSTIVILILLFAGIYFGLKKVNKT